MTKETLKPTDISNDMVVNVFLKIGLPGDGLTLDQKATTKERNTFDSQLKKVELAQGIIPCKDFSRQTKSPNVKEFISRAVSILKKAGLDPTKYEVGMADRMYDEFDDVDALNG